MKLDSVEEMSICNMIPISNFKSNHLSRKRHIDVLMKDDFMAQMSPSAGQGVRDVGFKNIDNTTQFSSALHGFKKFTIESQQTS
jgi:hypothetical protein